MQHHALLFTASIMGSCGILLKIHHARVSEQPPLTTYYVYYNYCENDYLYVFIIMIYFEKYH